MVYGIILVLNLLLASNLFAQAPALSACRDESCLRRLVPYDAKSPPSLDACKILEGKKSSADFNEDLGTLCRLVVSRALAGQRANDACAYDPENITPDWEMGLEQRELQKYYSASLEGPALAKNGVGPLSGSHGINNSTIHGSYVYDDQTREEGGKQREVSFATYFCIGKDPKHYTPYFWSLKLGGKVADQGYVANPPKVELVLLQNSLYSGFMEASELADVNGDGNKDLVLVEKDLFKGYRPLVCLYQPKQTECFPIAPGDFVKLDEMFIKAKLVVQGKQLKVEFSKDGKKIGEVAYQLSGKELKMTQKQGLP